MLQLRNLTPNFKINDFNPLTLPVLIYHPHIFSPNLGSMENSIHAFFSNPMFADFSVGCIVSFPRVYSALFGGFYPLIPKNRRENNTSIS